MTPLTFTEHSHTVPDTYRSAPVNLFLLAIGQENTMMSIPTKTISISTVSLHYATALVEPCSDLTSVCQLSSISSLILCEATFLLFCSCGQAKWLLQVAIR